MYIFLFLHTGDQKRIDKDFVDYEKRDSHLQFQFSIVVLQRFGSMITFFSPLCIIFREQFRSLLCLIFLHNMAGHLSSSLFL